MLMPGCPLAVHVMNQGLPGGSTALGIYRKGEEARDIWSDNLLGFNEFRC